MEVAALGLRVDGVDGVDRAADSLDRLKSSGTSAERAVSGLESESKKGARALGEVDRQGKAASSSMATLARYARTAGAALGAAFSVRALANYADTWSDMTSLVRVNIGAHEDAAAVMGRLSDIARMTYSSMELTAQGFAQNAFTLNALGKSTQQQLNYTEALNNALVVSGAKGQQAQMVQDSLNRALAEGSLRGQELQNVMNYGSRIAELLADELGVNVTQLRAMAKEGKITSDVIFTSLVGSMEELARQAETMPATIADGFQIIRNSVLQAVGVYDQANGLSEEFAEKLVDIGDAIRDADWTPYVDGLVLAAKLTAAYVIAVNAIPVSMALASAATAAYTAVLAAFSAQAAVTTAQLFTMRTAVAVVAAAFAGWQIGTYLRNQFEIVEKAGIALMGGLHTMAIQVGGYFERLGQSILFALTNPIDAFRNKLADLMQSLSALGQGGLRMLGLDGFADAISNGIERIRSQTGEEHRAMLEQMRKDTDAEAAMVSSIYADMFADVGRSAAEAAGATDELASTTDQLGGTVDNLSGKYKALQSAFEQTLADYHRQLNLAEDATLQEQLLYEVQYGRLQGLLPDQRQMLEGLAQELDMRAHLARIDEDERQLSSARDDIARELMTEEEKIQDSYRRRRDIVLAASFENEQARTELLLRLEQERNELLLQETGSYWERWLLSAEENLISFDEISKNVIENFTRGFGDAFESAIFDAEDWGESLQGITQGVARATVNAIGQMIAQETALRAVKLLRGEAAEKAAMIEVAAIAKTKAASLAATAQTVATQVAAAAQTFAAWLPSAIASSIGSFGAAAAIGLAAVTAAVAMNGFQKGGYTGDRGVSEVAGVVHGKEFVFDAAATARIGVANLEAMRAGRSAPASNVVPFPTMGTQSGPAAAPIINVYEAEGTSATVTTERNEQGQDVINIVLQNFLSDGVLATAVNSITGTQYQGS